MSWIMKVEFLCTHGVEYNVEDAKLTSCKGTDHDATCTQACSAEFHQACFGGDVSQATDHRSISTRTLLVDLREQCVCWVGDDSGDDSSNHAGAQRDSDVT